MSCRHLHVVAGSNNLVLPITNQGMRCSNSPIDVNPDIFSADQLACHIVERGMLTDLPHSRQVKNLRVATCAESTMQTPTILKLLQDSPRKWSRSHCSKELLGVFVDLQSVSGLGALKMYNNDGEEYAKDPPTTSAHSMFECSQLGRLTSSWRPNSLAVTLILCSSVYGCLRITSFHCSKISSSHADCRSQ